MAFMLADPPKSHVVIMDASGGNERRIATVGLSALAAPSWSPDGASILVVTYSTDFSSQSVHRVNIGGGSVEPLTDSLASIGAVVWLPDGRSFLMSATDVEGSPAQIWQVFLPSRNRRRITNDVNSYSGLSVSSDGRIVAAIQTETVATLRRLTGSYENGPQLLSGRRDDGSRGLTWSANGQIVFASSRSGKTELWSVQADGSQLRQLTENSGWSPATSKDGRWFVFVDGRRQLWRGSFDDSAPTLLTAASRVFHPMIDRDGSVHYYCVVNGQLKSFRLPLQGETPEETKAHQFFPSDTYPQWRFARLQVGRGTA